MLFKKVILATRYMHVYMNKTIKLNIQQAFIHTVKDLLCR